LVVALLDIGLEVVLDNDLVVALFDIGLEVVLDNDLIVVVVVVIL